jgi:hypothetical protein
MINTIMTGRKWEVIKISLKFLDRYNNMDKLVRAEFMRKDEAINSLKVIKWYILENHGV